MGGELVERLNRYAERLQNGESIEEPGLGADLADAVAEIERLKAEHSDGCVAVAEFDRLLDRAEQAEAEVERLKGEDKRWRTLTEYDSPECAEAGLAMREARLAQANAEIERLRALPTFSDGAKGAFEWQERAKRAETEVERLKGELCTAKAAHEGSAERAAWLDEELKQAEAKLERVVELVSRDIIDRVASCPKGSIGAVGNVYLCQIGTDEVVRWHADIAALAAVKGEQE